MKAPARDLVATERETRRRILCAADARLKSVQPALKCRLEYMAFRFLVRFDYPSRRLFVFFRDTGELMAMSQAGRPTRPAAMKGGTDERF